MAKGGSFENEIAKKLSLWWSDGESPEVFVRTGGSGSRATNRLKSQDKTDYTIGDITYNTPEGKPLIDAWSIECKTGYASRRKSEAKTQITNWCILDIIDSRQIRGTFLKLWGQAVDQSEKVGRVPVLIFRRPMMMANIAFPKDYFDFMRKSKLGAPISPYLNVHDLIVIMNLDTFFIWTSSGKVFTEMVNNEKFLSVRKSEDGGRGRSDCGGNRRKFHGKKADKG